MEETILNIYLIINDGKVVEFKAKAYKKEGFDDEKIQFLKKNAKEDFKSAYVFEAPINKRSEFMAYNKFAKLEEQGMHYELFEEIFTNFKVPENPLICVTPVVDGKIIGQ